MKLKNKENEIYHFNALSLIQLKILYWKSILIFHTVLWNLNARAKLMLLGDQLTNEKLFNLNHLNNSIKIRFKKTMEKRQIDKVRQI